MAAFNFLISIVVICANFEAVPSGIAEMFRMAFSFDSVAGGIGGSIVASMLTSMRWGVARGVFSNEAGLGSAPIAAAGTFRSHASRQGYVNMTGTFFDTMIICMLTGLVIASSGVLGTVDPATGKLVSGVQLTILGSPRSRRTRSSSSLSRLRLLFAPRPSSAGSTMARRRSNT